MVASVVSIEKLFVKEKMGRDGSDIFMMFALKNTIFLPEDAFLNFA